MRVKGAGSGGTLSGQSNLRKRYKLKYKVKKLIKTCEGYPSQWEVELEDGRMIYIRYRWGVLDVRISEHSTNDINDAVRGKSIYKECVGGIFDGVMEDEKMLLFLKNIIDI